MAKRRGKRETAQLDTTSHQFYVDANRGGGRKGRGRRKR
jgi:hypothetical protein